MAIVWKDIRMTSNTTPSPYKASANGEYGNQFKAYLAFTGTRKTSPPDCWATTTGTTTGYLQIDMGSPVKINAYRLSPRDIYDNGEYLRSAPNTWQLLGSNNGTDFTPVHTITGENRWNPTTHFITYELEDAHEYRYYRINITANNGAPNYTCIGQMNFGYDIERDIPVKMVIENATNFKMYSIDTTTSTLIEIVNGIDADVNTYGMKDNVEFRLSGLSLTKLKTVTRNGDTVTENTTNVIINDVHSYIGVDPNIVVYSEDPNDLTVSTVVDDYLLIDEIEELNAVYATTSTTAPKLVVNANHSPMDLLQGDFELVTWTDTDIDLEVEITKKNEESVAVPISDIVMVGINTVDKFDVVSTGDVRFSFSVDKGITYKTYVNGQWVTINNASEGISKDEMLLLRNDDMQKLLGDTDYLRIQYYLKGDLASLEDIKMTASFLDYEIMADTTKYGLDYDIPNKTVTVNFKTAGVYSISYTDSE